MATIRTRGAGVPAVALATAAEVRDLDDEGRLLAEQLAELGVDAGAVVWDDPSVRWQAFDLVVVRSTWDYAPRRTEFLAWADGLAAIANPAPLLRWSTDKRYLDDLRAAGVPIVPSLFVTGGDSLEHAFLDQEHVVKPTVSAGSRDTLRIGADDRARSHDHLRSILDGGRTALVQPYLDGVDELGETALIYIDGVFSHAIRKGPLLQPGGGLVEGLFAEEEIRRRDPSEAELAVGERAMAAIPDRAGGPPLYARVDLLPTTDSGPLVLELELAEPSLFLEHYPDAAGRLAHVIARRLQSSPQT